MKITVIITAYKDRGWLDDAIISAKNQTFEDYDIILTSDGDAGLSKYATRHGIDFCYTHKNSWVTAMNKAVDMAKGEWIKVLNDDDLLTKNCLKDLYNNRGDMVYGNDIIFNGTEKLYCPPADITIKNLLPLIKNPIPFPTVLFKKDVLLAVGGFDPEIPLASDYDFYINLLTHGFTISYCNSVVAKYRIHGNMYSKTYKMSERKRIKDYMVKKYKGCL